MYIHIYGQQAWHDAVRIRGDQQALRYLRTAIDEALQFRLAETPTVFVNDGDGYKIMVECLSESQVSDIQVPYEAEYARARG